MKPIPHHSEAATPKRNGWISWDRSLEDFPRLVTFRFRRKVGKRVLVTLVSIPKQFAGDVEAHLLGEGSNKFGAMAIREARRATRLHIRGREGRRRLAHIHAAFAGKGPRKPKRINGQLQPRRKR